MRRATLLKLSILIAGLGLAAQVSAQSRAISIDFPPETVGFYFIEKGCTWGLEGSLQWHSGTISQNYQTPGQNFLSHQGSTPDSAGVSGGIVYQRTVRDGPVQLFLFARPAGIYGWGRYNDYIHTKTILLEIAGGFGAAWSPVDSVALWVRQGVAFGRRIEESTHTADWGPEAHKDVTSLRLAPPSVQVVYLW